MREMAYVLIQITNDAVRIRSNFIRGVPSIELKGLEQHISRKIN